MPSYQEPQPAFGPLTGASASGHSVRVTDGRGSMDVSFLNGIGWCIETRYDEYIPDVRRQIFTGAQDSVGLIPPHIREEADALFMEAGDQTLRLSRDNGMITVTQGDHVVFESLEHPFRHHEKPIEIEEGIMSLKVTELSERTPFFPPSPRFPTSMARFQYRRPTGPVLGLPGQSGEVNRNGYRFELFNTDDGLHTPARRPLYQSWPIVFHADPSGTGWLCVFHDNPSRTFVDIGDFHEAVSFESQAGNTRVYILWAPTLAAVSSKLSQLLGGSLFPPLWAFGYQQCRWSYMTVSDIRKVVHSFRDHDIPLDCVYYDIDYMDGFRVFTNNALSFGEMAAFLRETTDAGIRSVCIVDPGVKIDDDYPVYRKVLESGRILKTADGEPFRARVWAGLSVFPDFGDEQMRDLWSDLQKDWLDRFPFDGVWNDMNEPANFDGQNRLTVTAHTGRGPIIDEYNLYGYHMAQASNDGMRKSHAGKRPFIITRSGYAGVQKNAVIWHGDNQAWWEHLRLALDTSIQYALCGAYYTGADVPGFSGNPPDDLAVRFFQLGAVMPLFRGHSIYFSKDKEPYAFGKEANAIIKDTIRLRYTLLREWYSGFERAVRENRTPIEPVFDRQNMLARDQFLLFGKLLVAPVIERDQQRRLVYLPEGMWYRLGHPEQSVTGGDWIMEPVTLKDLPIFVRAGSILVRNKAERNTTDTLKAPETYEVYTDADGKAEGYWYGDDGLSTSDPQTQRFRLAWDPSLKEVVRSPLESI